MKKKITVSQFAIELTKRIEDAKTIDCCKEEMLNLAKLAAEHMGDKLIEVTWKE
ncbi:MAG: hypothetical protein GY757_39655 [bacterium]|nr:hypothetical protein [bacterium]